MDTKSKGLEALDTLAYLEEYELLKEIVNGYY